MIELYGSVITGFEVVAQEEAASKLQVDCSRGRGFVRIPIDAQNIPEVLGLRSLDNVYAILYDYEIQGLRTADQKDAMELIRNEISRINWKTAVECWEIAHKKSVPGGVECVKSQMKAFVKNGASDSKTENFSFRVTCNRAGEKSRHNFSSMDAARALGGRVQDVFGWKPNMKAFDMEIVLNIRNDTVLVMVALNRESLFNRNVCAFGPTTMRSTMCYCMAALCEPCSGDIILDPMCGGGSIPLETAMAFSGCIAVGADVNTKALERCVVNLEHCSEELSKSGSVVQFLACDATNLPLGDNSVSAIVADLPFGKKIGSVGDNRVLYPRLLQEWERVAKPEGRLVIMTHDKRSWERALALHGGSWRVSSSHTVNVGGLQAVCVCLINRKCTSG